MANPVGLRLTEGGRIEYYDSNGFYLENGDHVMVNSEHGYTVAQVAEAHPYIPRELLPETLEQVLERATESDLAYRQELDALEAEALSTCRELVAEHRLKMQMERAIYTSDQTKLIFHFTADNRVDFRALVRDLAAIFHTRIELRQIGVREDAKLSGGVGCCGRELCCATFLKDFEPVSIKMVKTQNLSLNPSKISGHCGRLMCCLGFEQEAYVEARKVLPRIGHKIRTPQGQGQVVDLDLLRERITVQLEGEGDEGRLTYPAQELGYGHKDEDRERTCAGCSKHARRQTEHAVSERS